MGEIYEKIVPQPSENSKIVFRNFLIKIAVAKLKKNQRETI